MTLISSVQGNNHGIQWWLLANTSRCPWRVSSRCNFHIPSLFMPLVWPPSSQALCKHALDELRHVDSLPAWRASFLLIGYCLLAMVKALQMMGWDNSIWSENVCCWCWCSYQFHLSPYHSIYPPSSIFPWYSIILTPPRNKDINHINTSMLMGCLVQKQFYIVLTL